MKLAVFKNKMQKKLTKNRNLTKSRINLNNCCIQYITEQVGQMLSAAGKGAPLT